MEFADTYNPSIGLPPVTEGVSVEGDDKSPEALALRVVTADIEVARAANDSEKTRRTEAYELYRAMGDGTEDRPGRSQTKSSDVMDMIEWLMPSLMRAFFGSKSAISVEPIGSEDIVKAELFQKLLNWQFIDKGNGFRIGHEWMKSSLIYGVSPVKVTWQDVYVKKGFAFPELIEPQFEALRNNGDVESLTADNVRIDLVPPESPVGPQMNPFGPQMPQPGISNAALYTLQPYQLEPMRVYENVRGEERIKVYSGPLVEVIPPEDFFIDPEARDITEARFVIHRVKRTVTYLKQKEREGIYSNISKVIEGKTNSRAYSEEDDSETAMRATSSNDYSYYTSRNDVQRARRKINVWEWWGLLDVNDTGIAEPYLVVVANGVVIRMEKNPYAHGEPPFEVMRPILDIFTINGISIVDLVGEYQKIKTALMRQTLDNISFQNNQMWLVDENAGVDLNGLAHPRPCKIILTNNLNGVKQITPAPLEGSVFNVMEFIQSQLEQRTGITRYNQGLSADSLNKTATGINAIMNASSQRIELIARVMAETGFRRLYKKMLQLDQQFVDQKIMIRVYGKPLEISPDDLAGNFDVSVDIGGATNRDQQEVQQMMTLLNYSQLFLQLGVMKPENIYQATKKILTIWGIAEADKYISDPNDTQVLRQIIADIDNLGAQIQQGQAPDFRTLVKYVIAARQALAKIVSQDVSEQNPQPGVAPEGQREMNQASAGNMAAYAGGTIAGGPGE